MAKRKVSVDELASELARMEDNVQAALRAYRERIRLARLNLDMLQTDGASALSTASFLIAQVQIEIESYAKEEAEEAAQPALVD